MKFLTHHSEVVSISSFPLRVSCFLSLQPSYIDNDNDDDSQCDIIIILILLMIMMTMIIRDNGDDSVFGDNAAADDDNGR